MFVGVEPLAPVTLSMRIRQEAMRPLRVVGEVEQIEGRRQLR